jgi:hypothetical protein
MIKEDEHEAAHSSHPDRRNCSGGHSNSGTATADPSSSASCNGILTVNDAHNQNRDDISHEVIAAAQAGELPNPGAFFSFFAQYHGNAGHAQGHRERCSGPPRRDIRRCALLPPRAQMLRNAALRQRSVMTPRGGAARNAKARQLWRQPMTACSTDLVAGNVHATTTFLKR